MTSRFYTIPPVFFHVNYEKQEVFFMKITTEIVTMKTVPGTSKEDFVAIVDALEKDFHSKLSGFIDSELLYDEEADEWCMIQHWMSTEQLKSASKKMFQAEESALFVRTLDPKTVKMKVFPQINIWGK